MNNSVRDWYRRLTLLGISCLMSALVGLGAYFYVLPATPAVGVISIPFMPISEASAHAISKHLDFALADDDIKGVVIALSSPGGGAASSERLYLHARQARSEKPVVFVINGMGASGGYFMAMGGDYVYAQPTSLVGNVGVVGNVGATLPLIAPEYVGITGPSKLSGGDREHWNQLLDLAKDAFAHTVISERGARLQLTREELLEGRLYSGSQGVSLGLIDGLGGVRDGVGKAAELAGVDRYLVRDINAELWREYSGDGDAPEPPNGLLTPGSMWMWDDVSDYGELFPVSVGHPNIYYLYAGYGD